MAVQQPRKGDSCSRKSSQSTQSTSAPDSGRSTCRRETDSIPAHRDQLRRENEDLRLQVEAMREEHRYSADLYSQVIADIVREKNELEERLLEVSMVSEVIPKDNQHMAAVPIRRHKEAEQVEALPKDLPAVAPYAGLAEPSRNMVESADPLASRATDDAPPSSPIATRRAAPRESTTAPLSARVQSPVAAAVAAAMPVVALAALAASRCHSRTGSPVRQRGTVAEDLAEAPMARVADDVPPLAGASSAALAALAARVAIPPLPSAHLDEKAISRSGSSRSLTQPQSSASHSADSWEQASQRSVHSLEDGSASSTVITQDHQPSMEPPRVVVGSPTSAFQPRATLPARCSGVPMMGYGGTQSGSAARGRCSGSQPSRNTLAGGEATAVLNLRLGEAAAGVARGSAMSPPPAAASSSTAQLQSALSSGAFVPRRPPRVPGLPSNAAAQFAQSASCLPACGSYAQAPLSAVPAFRWHSLPQSAQLAPSRPWTCPGRDPSPAGVSVQQSTPACPARSASPARSSSQGPHMRGAVPLVGALVSGREPRPSSRAVEGATAAMPAHVISNAPGLSQPEVLTGAVPLARGGTNTPGHGPLVLPWCQRAVSPPPPPPQPAFNRRPMLPSSSAPAMPVVQTVNKHGSFVPPSYQPQASGYATPGASYAPPPRVAIMANAVVAPGSVARSVGGSVNCSLHDDSLAEQRPSVATLCRSFEQPGSAEPLVKVHARPAHATISSESAPSTQRKAAVHEKCVAQVRKERGPKCGGM